MKELNADVDAWEQTSLSTSFPGWGAGPPAPHWHPGNHREQSS
jgi:hypothetical protein